jgi:alcohol dehydrogenase class IV
MNNLSFSFACPRNIFFGPGKLKELPRLLKNYGKKILFLSIADERIASQVESILLEAKKEWKHFLVQAEPSVQSIEEIHYSLNGFIPDLVIALGGGSAIDTGKVLSALLTNGGELMDYLEVVGKGKLLICKSIPLIAIPTTAGTGSEVTRNAVVGVPEKKVKVSLRSPFIQPEIALIDPELTLSLPLTATMYSGMDAFVQVIEPYLSIKSNHFTDILCLDGIHTAASTLPLLFAASDDINNRMKMSWVSLLGGICLANSGLGAVHGFAGVIGGMFQSPHGAICASLLPAVIEANMNAFKRHDLLDSTYFNRYLEIFDIVTNKKNSSIQEGIDWFKLQNIKIQIPYLKDFGIENKDFSEIIRQAKVASSMKTNPVVLEDDELFTILEQAYDRS